MYLRSKYSLWLSLPEIWFPSTLNPLFLNSEVDLDISNPIVGWLMYNDSNISAWFIWDFTNTGIVEEMMFQLEKLRLSKANYARNHTFYWYPNATIKIVPSADNFYQYEIAGSSRLLTQASRYRRILIARCQRMRMHGVVQVSLVSPNNFQGWVKSAAEKRRH